jgi:hypothetical protein
MIQIRPGDLIAIRFQGRYYYALILDRIRLFGGNWVYVFHRRSDELLSADVFLDGRQSGFHAFVDFIHAKREDRITRLQRKVDPNLYPSPGYLKATHHPTRKASQWFIYDMDFNLVKRVKKLKRAEKKYPNWSRIDDVIMKDLVDKAWTPEKDVRI